MPRLVRLYVRHTLIGFALAAVFTALLLWLNVANLWHLVTHVSGGWLAAGLLWFFNGIVFSAVQFGIAVMGMAEKAPKPPAGGLPAPVAPAALAEPVRVQVGRRQAAARGMGWRARSNRGGMVFREPG
jgi:hypothetical protein